MAKAAVGQGSEALAQSFEERHNFPPFFIHYKFHLPLSGYTPLHDDLQYVRQAHQIAEHANSKNR